jgi:pimeloyl-ACP methyl ester carboxylesterase
MPLTSADKLRDKMHDRLLKISNNCSQIKADKSSHFIWIDEPELIINAIEELLK